MPQAEAAPIIKQCDGCFREKEIPPELIGAPPFGLVYCSTCYQSTYGAVIRRARRALEKKLFGKRIHNFKPTLMPVRPMSKAYYEAEGIPWTEVRHAT